MISHCDSVENIVGKAENAGYQHFLVFQQCFQMPPFSASMFSNMLSGSLKLKIVWQRVKGFKLERNSRKC